MRDIVDISKDLALAESLVQANNATNVYGLYGDRLAAIIERGSRLRAQLMALYAERDAWIIEAAKSPNSTEVQKVGLEAGE